MNKIIIPRIKYKQALKIVDQHKLQPNLQVPSVNMELRQLGLSEDEITSFWQSTSELRLILWQSETDLQRRVHINDICDADMEAAWPSTVDAFLTEDDV